MRLYFHVYSFYLKFAKKKKNLGCVLDTGASLTPTNTVYAKIDIDYSLYTFHLTLVKEKKNK